MITGSILGLVATFVAGVLGTLWWGKRTTKRENELILSERQRIKVATSEVALEKARERERILADRPSDAELDERLRSGKF
jgi:hypothetical protein